MSLRGVRDEELLQVHRIRGVAHLGARQVPFISLQREAGDDEEREVDVEAVRG